MVELVFNRLLIVTMTSFAWRTTKCVDYGALGSRVRSSSFSAVGPAGRTPISGVWNVSTSAVVKSVTACSHLCVSRNDGQYDNGCQGFRFRPQSCPVSPPAFAVPGNCQLVQFSSIRWIVFKPASSSCQQFYATSLMPPRNYALNRTAYQISTYAPATASRAVDGDYVSVSCTNYNAVQPWWAVDLGQPVQVHTVRVTNDNNPLRPGRLDNFMAGLTNVQPIVGRSMSSGSNYTVCGQFSGSVNVSETVNVDCAPNMPPYRYVIIQGMLSGAQAICLTEVVIF